MKHLIDMIGRQYGLLTVISRSPGFYERPKWTCRCSCGKSVDIDGRDLRKGNRTSCGCSFKGRPKHFMAKSPIYRSWSTMIQRCTNPDNSHYDRYGGRGIQVCERWMNFRNFYEDMGDRPDGYSLDRINNSGPYCKENCRWATSKQQGRNRRTNKFYCFKSKTKTWAEWAEQSLVSPGTLRWRVIKLGWDFEVALRTPVLRAAERPRDPLTGKLLGDRGH